MGPTVPQAGRHAASPPTPSTSSSKRATRRRSRRSASTCRTTRTSARSTAASRCRCRTSTRPTTGRRQPSSAGSSRGRRRRPRAPRSGAASPASSRPTCTRSSATRRARSPSSSRAARRPRSRSSTRRSRKSRADLVALYFLPDPKLVELGLVEAKDHARDRAGRVRGLHAQRARAAPPRPRGHADRRRPHAQPADDRPVADGELEGDRGARARRQDLLRDGRRQGVPGGRRPPARRGPAHQGGRRLRGGGQARSRPTAFTSTPRCATKSSRASSG